MSDARYPLGSIQDLHVELVDRTILDEFEAGNTSARRFWGDKEMKRRFRVRHSALTEAEFLYLRAFATARNGRYDDFWFRDNIHRSGNAKVRFAQPFQISRRLSSAHEDLEILLEETAPKRLLPWRDEVEAAANNAPLIWFDPNRDIAIRHAGEDILRAEVYDAAGNYLAAFSSGNNNLGGLTSAHQFYDFSANSAGADSAENITGFSGSKPAMTIFALVNPVTNFGGTLAHFAKIGAVGVGPDVTRGFFQNDDDKVYAIGGGTAHPNGVALTLGAWQSVAVAWTSGGDTANLWKNGTLTAAGTAVHSFGEGIFTMGAGAPNSSTQMSVADLAHVMLFNDDLSTAEVKALHNLFAYQYGMTEVA